MKNAQATWHDVGVNEIEGEGRADHTFPLVSAVVTAAAGVLVGTVGATVAGWHRDVGSTQTERDSALPGDDCLPTANLSATRAITIAAPPEKVWPWIAQLGQERGGFYSYTVLENAVGCRITNADTIVEEWQHPVAGEAFHLHPKAPLSIAVVEPGHALVAASPSLPPSPEEMGFTWAFVVEPSVGGGGRLVIRERYACPTPLMRAVVEATSWASLVMTLGTLRGVRARAER